MDRLWYIALGGTVVAVATRVRPDWFTRTRLRRRMVLALLVFASGWMVVTTATAAVGATFYGWGNPPVIWAAIALLTLLAMWLLLQTLRFYRHDTRQPVRSSPPVGSEDVSH